MTSEIPDMVAYLDLVRGLLPPGVRDPNPDDPTDSAIRVIAGMAAVLAATSDPGVAPVVLRHLGRMFSRLADTLEAPHD
jgi:hypothetical protein